jgi:tubulin-specific chaperone A
LSYIFNFGLRKISDMRSSIRKRLTIAFIGLAVGPLLLVGVVLAWQTFTTQEQQALNLQREMAQRVSNQVADFFEDVEDELRVVSRVQGLQGLDRDKQQSILAELLFYQDVFQELVLLDSEGQEQIHVSRIYSTDTQLEHEHKRFTIPQISDQVYYSPVYFDETTAEPLVTIIVPLFDIRTGQLDGELLADTRIKKISTLIMDTPVSPGQSVYIVDTQGEVVAHRTPSVVLRGTMFEAPTQDGIQPGLTGPSVILAVETVRLGDEAFNIVVEQTLSEALALAINSMLIIGSVIVAALVAGVVLVFLTVRQVIWPIQVMARAAQAISAGDLSQQVKMTHQDELGVLANAFNSMTSQLGTLISGLEEQVADRTRRLESVATLGERLNTILDPNDLLREVVNQIKKDFGYYYTQIYLLDSAGKKLVVAVGAGSAGREMTAKAHSIALDAATSLVARAARSGEIVSVANLQETEAGLLNPHLPETRAEIVVPIIQKGEVIGVLDVQENKIGGLDEGDANLLRSLANQVAVALQNARLFTETTQRATELETLSQVSRRLTTVLDAKQLIAKVVEQIDTAFNYYYTQIYLFDQKRENLVLAGGSGETGQFLLARQHSLPKGRGLVGRTAEQNEIVLLPDTHRHIGAEIITQANLEEIYRREIDPAAEAEWYARHIARYFGDVKTLADELTTYPDPSGKVLKIGYIAHVPGHFPTLLRRGAEGAARDLQIEAELVAPTRESEHLPLFEAMIRQGVDGLVVIPDRPGWVEPIRQAMAAGIPVVTANRELNTSPALMHVGLDNFQSGMMLAHELVKLLEAAGKYEGKILVGTGVADRNAGVRHGLSDTNYTLIEIEGFLEDVSFLNTYWEQAINRHPGLIAAMGLTMSEPPILAKIKRRTGGQWLIAGFDLDVATLEAIREGVVQVTIGQHPYLQGYLPILGLVEHLRQGKSLQGWMAEGWLPNAFLPETKTEVAVPIVSGDQVLGVLDVHHNVAGGLKLENANLLRSVADQVATALTNARLFEEATHSKEEAEIAKEKAEQAREEAEQVRKEIEIANKMLETQIWETTGQAQLNDKMRGEQDIVTLANNVIRQLCQYLPAQIGALYLAEGHTLSLAGSYAYSSKEPAKPIKFGQGLLGQAAVEKQPLLISDVPDNYITVSSGLGELAPRQIMVFPFMYEERVVGVAEMGTLAEFSQAQLKFIRTALDSIAIAFNTAQTRARVNELLAETQQQAEELQTQGEELRVANEELASQTESLRASEVKLKQKQAELEAINTQLEEKASALEESSAALREKQATLDRQNQELKTAQHELEKKAEELALASKYKSEFLANMSHELRTPLNSLLILARMLVDNKEGNLTEEQTESAQIIYSGGTDLLNLINDILDLSKVESGKMVFNFEAMLLTELDLMVRSQFSHVAEEKSLELNITLADNLPARIETDPQRLKQVIKNLLSNAFKFTTTGGVSLNIYRPGATVDLSRSRLDPSQAIAISVTDTGIGMTPDQQKIIFEAFQQADGSTSRKYGGTGLGLSISREMVSRLGGQINVESKPGQGSTFTLYLPISRTGVNTSENQTEEMGSALPSTPTPLAPRPPSAPIPASPPDDRANLGADDKIVVIIEDDPKFAKIVSDYAHKKGFKCLIAACGKTGLELVKAYQPGAIILDLNLPDISGWEVLEVLKHDPTTRHIPVHIISGDDEDLDAYRKGAIGYLTKPVSQEYLDEAFQKIENFISRQIKSLLLVEDDPNSRHSIKKLLGGGDVQISEAEQGQTALDLLKTQHFDCMILDLSLPDMTGFEILNTINQDEALAKCPVIVYTSRDLTPEENLELMKYAARVIVKGVKSPERLLDETALFLHRVVADMSEDKQQAIKQLYNKDTMLKDKKILIVDDDMRNSFALSKLLSDKGIAVKIARDGQKALDLLAQDTDVDLVLMDIMMPVLDGYETTRRIRAQQEFKTLPILALTAKAMKDDRDKCLAAGANDYLPKPVDIDRLFSMLRVWLYQ